MGSGRDSRSSCWSGRAGDDRGSCSAAAGFALLAADLQWANSHVLWTVGFLLNALWVALLVQFVLTFPEGRPWSRVAPFAIAGAFATTARRPARRRACASRRARRAHRHAAPDRWPTLSTEYRRSSGCGIALVLLVLLVRRLLVLRGPAQRAQAPLLAAAAFSVLAALPWLAWVVATRRRHPDARDDRRGRSRCSSRSASSQGSCGRGCAVRRRPTSSSSSGRRGRPACASASPAHSAIRRSTLPIGSTTAATSTSRAGRSSCRRARTGQSRS